MSYDHDAAVERVLLNHIDALEVQEVAYHDTIHKLEEELAQLKIVKKQWEDSCISNACEITRQAATIKDLEEKLSSSEGGHDMAVRKIMRLEDRIRRLETMVAANEAKATEAHIEVVRHEYDGIFGRLMLTADALAAKLGTHEHPAGTWYSDELGDLDCAIHDLKELGKWPVK